MGAFDGTILAVVHDRYFIKRFATQIWAIREGAIHTHVHIEDMLAHQSDR
jgi:ATPase subunit of ABC transporter with duplicated ATPase domains